MPYVTIDEFRSFLGTERVSGMLRDQADITDNLTRFSIARLSVEEEIDDALQARGVTVPLSTPPNKLKLVEVRMLHFELAVGRPLMDENVQKGYDKALKMLDQIAEGEAILQGVVDNMTEPFFSNTEDTVPGTTLKKMEDW